jgi:hypothetical protein
MTAGLSTMNARAQEADGSARVLDNLPRLLLRAEGCGVRKLVGC